MTLQEILADIHAINEDLEGYESKYGVLSETFYKSYTNGEEPENECWVLDWAYWAGAHKILIRRKEQYPRAIQALRKHPGKQALPKPAFNMRSTAPNIPALIQEIENFLEEKRGAGGTYPFNISRHHKLRYQ